MTIEERIGLCSHCLADETRPCHSDCHLYSKYKGAAEQKEIDDTLMSEERQKAFKIGYDIAVDEACKWVDDNVGTMTAIALRKAMEEE